MGIKGSGTHRVSVKKCGRKIFTNDFHVLAPTEAAHGNYSVCEGVVKAAFLRYGER